MKSSYLNEARELLSRSILTLPDVNALEKKSRKLELDFGTLVLSMFEQAKPGDVLSRIGLSVWRKLLTEIQDKLPSLDNRLVLRLLKTTRFDSTRIRSADIETWLELLFETQVVRAFSNLSPAKHAKELATWVTQLTTQEPRGEWLLELLHTLAPTLSKQTVPVLIGYNYRDMVFVDVRLIDCCLQLHIPFELADGYRVFSIRHWAAAAKGSRRVSSNLASTLAHRDYGPPVRNALIDALCNSSTEDFLVQSVHQHDNLRRLFAGFVGEKLEMLVNSDLRGALRVVESLNYDSIKNTIRIDTNLRKRLRVLRIDEILRRALRAGVFDEIGLKTLDEAVDKRGLEYSKSLWYQHFYFSFPFVSFVDHKEIVSCGPNTVTARPVPSTIPREGIHWVIPIRDDVLIVCFPVVDHMRMVTARDAEMTWLSNPEVRKKGGQIEPFTTFVSVMELPDGRFSMGKKPFAIGKFPVGFPFEFVFCEAAKVWTLFTPMTSVGNSIDPEFNLDTRLTGWDCEANEKIDDSLPEFFASSLLPNATPMLDNSYLVPKPKELEETRLGSADSQLGFFAQGTPDGVAWGVGIDGRKTSRKFKVNERGVPICDIPLCMMDKPGSRGFWTFVKRQRDVHVIDESSGDEIAAFSSAAHDMPGQTCEILNPVFWNLYSVRCQQTSRQLRKVTTAAASRLLKAALLESFPAKSDPLGEFTKEDCPHIRKAVAAEFPHAPERLARGLASTCITAAKLKKSIDSWLS